MMRLVEGTDLRELIASEGKVEPLRAARIARQVGGALDAAHARGLVHRDVKPANVLLARADHVYLSDFGLAKREEEGGGLTRQGSIVARAEYVAPEQLVEDRVDALTDVYALGCLLYESLHGPAALRRLAGGPGDAGARQRAAAGAEPGAPRPAARLRRRRPAGDGQGSGRALPVGRGLGEAALVAAGGQRRANAESLVATGPAAPIAAMPGLSSAGAAVPDFEPIHAHAPGGEPIADEPRDRATTLKWGVALGHAGGAGGLHGGRPQRAFDALERSTPTQGWGSPSPAGVMSSPWGGCGRLPRRGTLLS